MTRDEIRIIDVLVWFANAKLTSKAQVEKQFRAAVSMHPDDFKGLPAADLKIYREIDQPRAREYLRRIIDSDCPAIDLGGEIMRFVGSKVRGEPKLEANRKGGFKLRWVTRIDDVEGAIAYACALLLDESLRRRVGLCAYPSKGGDERCTKFFFDKRKRGGRPQAYCSTKHSDADRMRRHRSTPDAAKHK
jgi:hypothetical protein